ncbi:hypothetical protein PSPO01_05675 [Paraphaeosphaeria sporulosa]
MLANGENGGGYTRTRRDLNPRDVYQAASLTCVVPRSLLISRIAPADAPGPTSSAVVEHGPVQPSTRSLQDLHMDVAAWQRLSTQSQSQYHTHTQIFPATNMDTRRQRPESRSHRPVHRLSNAGTEPPTPNFKIFTRVCPRASTFACDASTRALALQMHPAPHLHTSAYNRQVCAVIGQLLTVAGSGDFNALYIWENGLMRYIKCSLRAGKREGGEISGLYLWREMFGWLFGCTGGSAGGWEARRLEREGEGGWQWKRTGEESVVWTRGRGVHVSVRTCRSCLFVCVGETRRRKESQTALSPHHLFLLALEMHTLSSQPHCHYSLLSELLSFEHCTARSPPSIHQSPPLPGGPPLTNVSSQSIYFNTTSRAPSPKQHARHARQLRAAAPLVPAAIAAAQSVAQGTIFARRVAMLAPTAWQEVGAKAREEEVYMGEARGARESVHRSETATTETVSGQTDRQAGAIG